MPLRRRCLRLASVTLALSVGACGAGSLTPAIESSTATAAGGTASPLPGTPGGGGGGGPTGAGATAGSAGGNASSTVSSSDPGTATSGSTTSGSTTAGSPNATPTAAGTGLRLGVLPDYDNAATNGLAGFIARTSITPGANSGYVNVGPNGGIETATGIGYIDASQAAGVPVVSLSMTAKQSGALTSAQIAGVQAMIAEAQRVGITLWLRYGYEMNYGGGDGQYANINEHNDPTDFKKQWAQVAALANPYRASKVPVKMFWSPNINSGGDLPYAQWEPDDPKTIDVVGVDWYHKQGDALDVATLVSTTQDIYAIAAALQVPFLLGETAVSATSTDASEASEKMKWLAALTSRELQQQLPLYQGFFWFDYEKGGTNFALSQDSQVAGQFSAWYPTVFGAAAGAASGSTTAGTGTGAASTQTTGTGAGTASR